MSSLAAPPADRLPDGFAVRLDPRTQRRDDGAALLGGSPLRMLRLAPAARAVLAGDRIVVTDARTAALAGRLLDTGVAHPDLTSAALPLKSKRCRTSFIVWLSAFPISARSTCETISNEFC